jgi:hypothetical protein
MAKPAHDEDGIRTVGPPPPDPSEPTVRMVVGFEEARNFYFEFVVARGRLAGTVVTGVVGYVGYQLLPGQRPYVLAAAAVAILGWILAPKEWSDRLPLPGRRQRR